MMTTNGAASQPTAAEHRVVRAEHLLAAFAARAVADVVTFLTDDVHVVDCTSGDEAAGRAAGAQWCTRLLRRIGPERPMLTFIAPYADAALGEQTLHSAKDASWVAASRIYATFRFRGAKVCEWRLLWISDPPETGSAPQPMQDRRR